MMGTLITGGMMLDALEPPVFKDKVKCPVANCPCHYGVSLLNTEAQIIWCAMGHITLIEEGSSKGPFKLLHKL